jgi:Asp-tRNA(Asn)/Glu-tRNA(Gln) amidotransferase A subunit family amidase
MSLKDQFNVEGLDSTLGYVGRAFAPADADAIIVSILKSLGAVIVAKTNLPQSIMVKSPTLTDHEFIDRRKRLRSGAKRRILCGD